MEVSERRLQAEAALDRFRETRKWDLEDPMARDAAIKRFELAFEAVLRALQAHLRDEAGIAETASKRIVRGALDARLLTADQTEAALAMANDRNLSVHIYREEMAVDLARRLPDHLALLETIARALSDA